MKWLYCFWAWITGKNPSALPPDMIMGQLTDPRPLPMGRIEFDEWAKRIIAGALVPNEDGLRCFHDELKTTPEQLEKLLVFKESQLFTVANLLLHLGPTESHKPDAFFIHSLRKFAVNQVADTIRVEIRDKAKARLATEEANKKAVNEANQGSV